MEEDILPQEVSDGSTALCLEGGVPWRCGELFRANAAPIL
jgi:hypothetical protein